MTPEAKKHFKHLEVYCDNCNAVPKDGMIMCPYVKGAVVIEACNKSKED